MDICIYDIDRRDKWNNISTEMKDALIEEGKKAAEREWPHLLLSDYLEFNENGNRVNFENKYFDRRRKLNSLVLAECVENKGRFLSDILDGIFLILGETAWWLPAHNSYIRDTRQLPVPDPVRPIIDLFAAETGAELAVLEYILRPVFSRKASSISAAINAELERRIIKPYLTEHFWWMGNGDEPMCNWTSWCTQNVLLTFLTRPAGMVSSDVMKKVADQAVYSLKCLLSMYGSDGYCDEGAMYYGHAGLTIFGSLILLDTIAPDNELSYAFKDTKIRNIADFIRRVYVGDGYYFNFSDCAPIAGRRGAREYLFGLATDNTKLAAFAAKDYKEQTLSERLIRDEINLWYHILQIFNDKEMLTFVEGLNDGQKSGHEAFMFADAGLLTARNSNFVLAAKAGCNGDSHNHNDTGSFIAYKMKDGHAKPFAIDLGVGTYTKKTFSPDRYDIWTMQSQFHNVPTFVDAGPDKAIDALIAAGAGAERVSDAGNDPALVLQKTGKEYKASDIHWDTDGDTKSISMQLAEAYGDRRIGSLFRNVSLGSDGRLIIEDSCESSLTPVMSLMTYEKPEFADESKTVINIGDIGTIRLTGAKDVRIQTCPINDERLNETWKHDCYRILIAWGQARFSIVMY